MNTQTRQTEYGETILTLDSEGLRQLRGVYEHAVCCCEDSEDSHAYGISRVAEHFNVSEEIADCSLSYYGA